MSAFPTPLIDATALLDLLQSGAAAPLLIDASFDLADPSAGERAFAAGHLPGAVYAHLDRDLSRPPSVRGSVDGGRHPLPARDAFAQRVADWGLTPDRPVVAYDRQGSPYAARLWWMLRWLGHGPVAVLDGGWSAWQAVGGPQATGEAPPPAPTTRPYACTAPRVDTVSAADLLGGLGTLTVIDARAPERFRGEVEPLDAQAGHIPGARNRFFRSNLGPDERFRPATELREAFDAYGVAPGRIVHQCGSGVTACHNLLAMEVAGRTGSRLYPGSWSEWSSDPTRPIARA